MLNFRKWTETSRARFRILVAVTFCLIGLTLIHSSGFVGGTSTSLLPQDEMRPGSTSQGQQLPPEGKSSRKPDKKPKASSLYRKHCQKCHCQDGTGVDCRDTFPEIPDFTSEKWQKARNNARLVWSILDGKGTSMPPFAEKLSSEEIKVLAAFVRSFDLPVSKPRSVTEDDFDEKTRQLLQEMNELRKQFHELSKRVGDR